MKKLMWIAAVVALAGMQVQTARAGDREWATAGKVLTGVFAGAVIAGALDAHANVSVGYYGYDRPGGVYAYRDNYCPPRAPVVTYYCPPPVAVYRAPVVCEPRVVYYPPVVVYRQDSHRGRHHGWVRSQCR